MVARGPRKIPVGSVKTWSAPTGATKSTGRNESEPQSSPEIGRPTRIGGWGQSEVPRPFPQVEGQRHRRRNWVPAAEELPGVSEGDMSIENRQRMHGTTRGMCPQVGRMGPYSGKPAVRMLGGHGNGGIIRSPIRATVLPGSYSDNISFAYSSQTGGPPNRTYGLNPLGTESRRHFRSRIAELLIRT